MESERWHCSHGWHVRSPHFRHRQHVMNMNHIRVIHESHMSWYMSHTSFELADIPFISGLANENGHSVVLLYGERYPTRWQPNHKHSLGCIRTWRKGPRGPVVSTLSSNLSAKSRGAGSIPAVCPGRCMSLSCAVKISCGYSVWCCNL